jgi:hypothetical protein
LEGLLLRRGYGVSRLSRNVGHNQGRLCFIAQAGDLSCLDSHSESGAGFRFRRKLLVD